MAQNTGGRVLALIPVLVGLLLAALLFPRDVPPDDVPLPDLDLHKLAETEHADDARAALAAKTPLDADVRALGEAMRTFNTTEAKDPKNAPWADIRAHVDEARALALAHGSGALLELRAAQLAKFLHEVDAWRKTGNASDELEAEGGGFVRRMTIAGYAKDHTLAVSDRELRPMFKLKWNSVARFDDDPAFALSLDENRALYMFYILHPHATENARETFAAARRTARTRADCEALAVGERIASEQWRLEKIERLGQIDPTYPLAYARGVALYRAAKYEASARAFEEWLRVHPDGPLTLRARNHLRAAIAAARVT
jgi:hypothetical protein